MARLASAADASPLLEVVELSLPFQRSFLVRLGIDGREGRGPPEPLITMVQSEGNVLKEFIDREVLGQFHIPIVESDQLVLENFDLGFLDLLELFFFLPELLPLLVVSLPLLLEELLHVLHRLLHRFLTLLVVLALLVQQTTLILQLQKLLIDLLNLVLQVLNVLFLVVGELLEVDAFSFELGTFIFQLAEFQLQECFFLLQSLYLFFQGQYLLVVFVDLVLLDPNDVGVAVSDGALVLEVEAGGLILRLLPQQALGLLDRIPLEHIGFGGAWLEKGLLGALLVQFKLVFQGNDLLLPFHDLGDVLLVDLAELLQDLLVPFLVTRALLAENRFQISQRLLQTFDLFFVEVELLETPHLAPFQVHRVIVEVFEAAIFLEDGEALFEVVGVDLLDVL